METKLPVTNQNGYYEIRMESIGGLGANLCGKMLGELGVYELGLNSASFSSYGSEKTGTPVKAYIRYCEAGKEIRAHSPVVRPHLLVIFHEALLQDASVLEGCTGETQLIIHTEKTPREIEELYLLQKGIRAAGIFTVAAQRLAMETHARINVVMLGAAAAVMGFVPPEAVKRICERTLGRKYPDSLAANLAGIERGFHELQGAKYVETKTSKEEDNREHQFTKIDSQEPQWGYETAPPGGINPCFGSSVTTDLSASRQGYLPIFRQEKCINCGLCDSTCPDMVFQFAEGIYKGKKMQVNRGLDYYHCKGCLRCVDVCPTGALVRGVESEHTALEHFLPNQELLYKPSYYEKSGADGYITSESYLTEKRMEGGEV